MSELADVLQRHVDDGVLVGAVAAVGPAAPTRDGGARPVGAGRMALDGPPMPPDAVMRVQSMTKVVLAAAVLRLVETDGLRLEDEVARWLPELADPQVLEHPGATLDRTVPAERAITVRHLLTCTSGYGIVDETSPLGAAMERSELAAGPRPWALDASTWVERLGALPLVGQPGEVWRYHHSFGLLGVLLSRRAGRPLHEHLREVLLDPLEMPDTGSWVPQDQLHRLPAAYRWDDALVETDPLHAGSYAGDPGRDVSHGELVSTAADVLALLRMLHDGRDAQGHRFIGDELRRLMRTDAVPDRAKTRESFPYSERFWEGTGWGLGVGIRTAGPGAGRFGWTGGLGTDCWLDPSGWCGVALVQTEMSPPVMGLLGDVDAIADPRA
ncbi:serine hydrolase domain-containing protein [Janibacter melonis]|uniref:serine hydrolase domain-containing protein n=1 Tax=Janibacter melonis TaxID=262209 RepID=UPI00174E3C9B|nr:serine hydrolase domain-containing protein [Janibacter melonis]